MQDLGMHMKNNHNETDSMRLERLERSYKTGSKKVTTNEKSEEKIFDCSECGLLFHTEGQINIHNTNKHPIGAGADDWKGGKTVQNRKSKNLKRMIER